MTNKSDQMYVNGKILQTRGPHEVFGLFYTTVFGRKEPQKAMVVGLFVTTGFFYFFIFIYIISF